LRVEFCALGGKIDFSAETLVLLRGRLSPAHEESRNIFVADRAKFGGFAFFRLSEGGQMAQQVERHQTVAPTLDLETKFTARNADTIPERPTSHCSPAFFKHVKTAQFSKINRRQLLTNLPPATN
jgi:hypothetical protein